LKSSAKKIELASVDDLFSTEESRQDAAREKIMEIPLSELFPFEDHPFSVRDDDAMKETVESVKEVGVVVPAIARPREGGGYELIAGHRRKRACELAGLETMPVIVRDLDRDAAIIAMVDSNLQRENILPLEKAKAYKMKMEAINRRAGRPVKTVETMPEENGGQVGHNFRGVKTREIVAEGSEDSARTIQRYIRLTELSPELQRMVDDKKIAMTPAVEISYLKPEEQALLVETMESEQATPSLSQAQRMKRMSQEGKLTEDTMLSVMSEQKKPEVDRIVFTSDTLRKYFPKSYTPKKMEETIINLLEGWMKKRQRGQER
jgi:ParB family chromosome partitioning protein